MWFAYANAPAQWLVLPVAKVKEIVALNKKERKVAALEDYVVESTREVEKNLKT